MFLKICNSYNVSKIKRKMFCFLSVYLSSHYSHKRILREGIVNISETLVNNNSYMFKNSLYIIHFVFKFNLKQNDMFLTSQKLLRAFPNDFLSRMLFRRLISSFHMQKEKKSLMTVLIFKNYSQMENMKNMKISRIQNKKSGLNTRLLSDHIYKYT